METREELIQRFIEKHGESIRMQAEAMAGRKYPEEVNGYDYDYYYGLFRYDGNHMIPCSFQETYLLRKNNDLPYMYEEDYDKGCEVMNKLLKIREDPAMEEEYYHMMLERVGYEQEEANKILVDYYDKTSPFHIEVEGEDFIKDDLNDKSEHRLSEEINTECDKCNEYGQEKIESLMDYLERDAIVRLGRVLTNE